MHIYLNDYLEKRQLLHPFHSGFRRKSSCNFALARLTNSWLTAMNKSEVSGVVFVDLKKAFDLVDHDILLKKLAIYLKNSSSLPFFKSYLHNRTQCILLHGSYSSKESVKYGVPQGCIKFVSGNWKSRHWWSGWLLDPSASRPVGAALWYWKHWRSPQREVWRFGVSNFMDSAALIWGYIMTILHLTGLKMAVHFTIFSFLSFMAISHQKYKYQCRESD